MHCVSLLWICAWLGYKPLEKGHAAAELEPSQLSTGHLLGKVILLGENCEHRERAAKYH